MQSPKVVVVGAGSLFFGRQALWAMIHSEVLRNGTLAYVDTNAARLDKMMRFGKLAIEKSGVPLKLEGSIDRRDVLGGADFVVLSFANEGVFYRGVDCEIALRHNSRMCSGDTIGPGGVFRAMRELPEILNVARDVEEICPEAWVINYINPTAVNGVGLQRYANVKTFALCDGLHMPHVKRNYMRRAGLLGPEEIDLKKEAKFDLRIAGVNHFTWVLGASYEGRDVTGKILDAIREVARGETNTGYSKARFNSTYSAQLADAFGLIPACIGHTKEYVRYWQGWGASTDGIPPLAIFESRKRQIQHDKMWSDIDGYLSGTLALDRFFKELSADHATDIIEAMWTNSKNPFYINTLNNGAVSNLPDNAVLELLCDVDMNGPRPRPAGEFPLGIRSLQMQIIDTHELTAEAIVKADRNLLLRALLTDPIVPSVADAKEMIAEVLEEERAALPAAWYADETPHQPAQPKPKAGASIDGIYQSAGAES